MYEYSPVGAIAEYGMVGSAATVRARRQPSTAQRRAGANGCCDNCSCNCAGSGCCPDCVAQGVKRSATARRSGTAMQGLGAIGTFTRAACCEVCGCPGTNYCCDSAQTATHYRGGALRSDWRARRARTSGGMTAMRGLGATTAANVVKTISIPAFAVAQPPPGSFQFPQQSSRLPMLLALAGVGVAGFFIVRKIRAGRAAQAR